MRARPSSRSHFGDFVLILFFLAQGSDGVLTYLGVTRFGNYIEANPIVAWYAAVVGVGLALIGLKGLAMACGAALHLRSMHRTVGLLTMLYLAAAVWPWARLLWP